jgi:hypothetical protein
MKIQVRNLLSGFAIFFLIAIGSAHAASILSLFNTGVDDTGALLSDNALDTHYAISPGWTVIPGNNPPAAFPGAWLTNDVSPVSRWIAPVTQPANLGAGDPGTTYILTLSFDLTGYDPASASFSGRFAADDSAQIFLNGGTNLVGAGLNTYNSWTTFSAVSGFVSGINTLAFHVSNTGWDSITTYPLNPAGLRVEFLSSNVAPVPEPEIYAMMGLGLGLLGWIGRRKKVEQTAAAA